MWRTEKDGRSLYGMAGDSKDDRGLLVRQEMMQRLGENKTKQMKRRKKDWEKYEKRWHYLSVRGWMKKEKSNFSQTTLP